MPVDDECTAVDEDGNEVTFDPISPGNPTPTSIDDNGLFAVACPSPSQCTAVDDRGDQVTFDPSSPGSPTGTEVDYSELSAVACPSTSECTAVDGEGDEVTFDPISPGSPNPTRLANTSALVAVACPSTSQCTAIDEGGDEVTFDPMPPGGPSYTLSVSLAGTGSGSVSGSGISCPFTCGNYYTSGTVVTLTATPSAGSTFAGWSGGGCSGTGPCTVTLSEDQAVTADFERPVADTSLTLSPAKVVYGHEQVERLSVSVSSNTGGLTPTGTVAVQYFPKTVCVITLSAAKGSCTLKATQLHGGAYSLIARYSGSPVFAAAFSAQKLLLVDKAKSKTTLKLSGAKVLYDHEHVERLSVSISSTAGGSKPSGKVTVKEKLAAKKSATKTVCVITLSAAKGSCTLKAAQLLGGTYSLVATYSGSLDFDTSVSAKQTLTVAK